MLKPRVMDPGLVIALVFFGPLQLLAFVSRTRFSWIPGALLMAAGAVVFGMIEPVRDDVGGIGAIGNGVLALEALALFFYGLVLLGIGVALYRKRERRQPSPLPVATAVAGVTKD